MSLAAAKTERRRLPVRRPSRPLASASGMKSSGRTRPRWGCCQRARTSKPRSLPVRSSTSGWKKGTISRFSIALRKVFASSRDIRGTMIRRALRVIQQYFAHAKLAASNRWLEADRGVGESLSLIRRSLTLVVRRDKSTEDEGLRPLHNGPVDCTELFDYPSDLIFRNAALPKSSQGDVQIGKLRGIAQFVPVVGGYIGSLDCRIAMNPISGQNGFSFHGKPYRRKRHRREIHPWEISEQIHFVREIRRASAILRNQFFCGRLILGIQSALRLRSLLRLK